jgi:hypothetical protein
MPTICFMYRIDNDPKIYYGKYIADYISDDHDGLDLEVFDILKKCYDMPLSTFKVGILSCSANNNFINYTSEFERTFFDFYYVHYNNMRQKEESLYINGIEKINN